MKITNNIVVCVFVFGLCGCVDSTIHHGESPLPIGSSEQRARAHAADARVLNPALTKSEAAGQASAITAGQEAKAEAEWRQKKKADADHEKFIKDLDAVSKSKGHL